MRWPWAVAGGVAVAAVALVTAAPSTGAATSPTATWEMNEPTGGTVMLDASGEGITGSIGSAVLTNTVYAGATGYRWPFTKPNEPPAKPERLVVVDDPRINPGSADFSVTIRFRTTHSFGNMLQKGQSGNTGGMFKWQIPAGQLTCVIKGYDAQGNLLGRSVNSGDIPLNDGNWHVATCARTATEVTLTIDGVRTRRAVGPTGTISNNVPLTLGGKLNCDQISVTCDYFAGDMDYVHVEIGDGEPGGDDTTAPTVTNRTPSTDAVAVLRGTNVTATFSEPVSGVSPGTMSLTKASTGAPIAATITYEATSRTATLNPDPRLPANTRFTVALGSGIQDSAGNPLAPTNWSFTTGS